MKKFFLSPYQPTCPTKPWRRRVNLSTVLLLLALGSSLIALLNGCATVPKREYVFPPPPDRPRLKYLYDLAGYQDLYPRRKVPISVAIWRFLVGEGERPEAVFTQPYNVCADENRVYVTDVAKKGLFVFDFSTKRIYQWGTRGPGRLDNPMGVTVDDEGRVYVSDGSAVVVKVYDRNGNFLFQFGRVGWGPGEFNSPVGLALYREKKILYVLDFSRSHRVQAFDLQGNFLYQFGRSGNADGEFGWPVNITTDKEGKVYVVDNIQRRFQIFDATGKFVRAIGEPGDIPGCFARPKGIAVDSDSQIYVSDTEFNTIQIFNQEGLLCFFYSGVPPLFFNQPQGLYFDHKDRLYVVDTLNKRIQVYQYLK